MLDRLKQLHPRSLAHLAKHLDQLVKGRLWLKVLVGMGLGIGVGIALGPSVGWVSAETGAVVGQWLALPGELFLGAIQMIAVPLVVASIVRGLAAGEGLDQLRQLGVRLTAYFVATTAFAVTLGLTLALIIKPGSFVDAEPLDAATPASTADSDIAVPATIPEFVRQVLPVNPLSAMVEGQMLQIVLFAIVFGIALIAMKPAQARPLLELLGSLQEVCMTIVRWAMRLAPVAVFGLLARVSMSIGLGALIGMAVYVGTVLLGLLVLGGSYVVLAKLIGQRSPASFLHSARNVQLLAFSTSSSAAVMPMSIRTAEQELGVRPSIAQFVVPLGATINMDGTALYQAVATVFLAQVTGIHLSIGVLALIVVTAVGASIGSPSTPGVGIVLLASVVRSAGIPVEALALIIGVDRILDMSRTAANVTGDLTACLVMDRWVGSAQTAREERAAQAERDVERSASGQDVIVQEQAG